MQSLSCRKAKEILLILKSSYLTSADLEKAENLHLPIRLNLSKFHKLRESMIFRAFIKERNLIAACQKETSAFYDFLSGLSSKITEKIQEALQEVLNICPFPNFTFDIYLDLPPRFKVFILGFNSFNDPTDPLLFTWDELRSLTTFHFRLVDQDSIKPSNFSAFRVPIEISSGQDISEFIDSLKSK